MLSNIEKINNFPSVTVYTYKDKFLYFKIKEGAVYGLEEMIAVTEFITPLARQGRRFFITDLRVSFIKFTNEAQDWNAKYDLAKELKFRNALLVNNLFIRLFTNTFIYYKKPNIPTKSFTNEKSALAWLNAQD